jgi:tetratricopeptide (TPR) repeat protein
MVTVTVYRAVVHNARAMACFVSSRHRGHALRCAVAALLLCAGCATDLNREQLAVEYFNLGTGYLELGEAQQAAGYFERGLELQPLAGEARFNLAVALLELGDAATASGHLDLLLAADPGNVRVLELLAISHQRRGRLGDALAAYRRLLRAQPEHTTARYNSAILLWSLAELPAAAAELRALLRHDPDDREARYRLGLLLAQTGPPAAAAAELGRYLEAVPDDADALVALAQVERQRGRFEAALDAYAAAAGLLPAAGGGRAELAFERAAMLLTALEDHSAGLAALTLALENGFRDLDRLTELLLEEGLVRRGAVLDLITAYFPELVGPPAQ